MHDITFHNDPATSAAIHRRQSREAKLRAAALKRARDPRPLAERIADAMLELAGSGQTVDRAALGLRGFTAAEMSDEMLGRARDIANASVERRVA